MVKSSKGNNKLNNLNKKVHILLPSRIGDSILNLPSLLCLKQLNEKLNKNLNITVFSSNSLTDLFNNLDLFEFKQFNNMAKLKTIINKPDITVFFETSTKNYCYFSIKSFGINNDRKKINYHVNMPYLNFERADEYLPKELIKFLTEKFQFSPAVYSCFGMILELGFSVEEIIKNFEFNEKSLNLKSQISDWKPLIENYVVTCMEAAYGSKRDSDRRLNAEYYLNISKEVFEKYELKTAFIGIDTSLKLPNAEYICDYRKKLSINELVSLINYSKAYIGNDTGPLHISNLLKKPSLGIYTRENTIKNYSPIFKQLNTIMFKTFDIEVFNDFCEKILFCEK